MSEQTSPPTNEQPDGPSVAIPAQQMTFWFPYEFASFEEETIREVVALIAVMLKNGAGITELQQRLMGFL
jgi:hypothetical protein